MFYHLFVYYFKFFNYYFASPIYFFLYFQTVHPRPAHQGFKYTTTSELIERLDHILVTLTNAGMTQSFDSVTNSIIQRFGNSERISEPEALHLELTVGPTADALDERMGVTPTAPTSANTTEDCSKDAATEGMKKRKSVEPIDCSEKKQHKQEVRKCNFVQYMQSVN